MIKLPIKHEIVLTLMAIALVFFVHFLQATPALSATEVAATEMSQPEAPLLELNPGAIATAAQPPKLVPAVLGGKPVYVLYSTQPNDVEIWSKRKRG